MTRWPLLLALLLGAAGRGDAGAREADPIHLVVLHTNDLHGQLHPCAQERGGRGGLVRLSAELDALRSALNREGAEVLLLDGGDWSQGTPEGSLEGGRAYLSILARLGYDAMCVGNHDLDHGVQALRSALRTSELPAVLANARERATGQPVDWCPPWRIVQRAGLRIAIVGLLTTDAARVTAGDLSRVEFLEPSHVLDEALVELAARDVDLVIALTHQGLAADLRLAREHDDLPLIVGAHSHSFLEHGRRVGETLVVQAGDRARVLGRVDLFFDAHTRRVTESRAALIELGEAPADARSRGAPRGVSAACARLAARTKALASRVVGRLASDLERGSGSATSPLGNLVTDALRTRAGAAVCILNKGGLRRDLAAGEVRARDVFELLPFDDTLVVVELAGAELEALLRRALETRPPRALELSGATLELARGGRRLLRTRVAGAALDPERCYLLATSSFLARGEAELFAPPALASIRDSGVLLRDVLSQAFADENLPATDRSSRIRVLD